MKKLLLIASKKRALAFLDWKENTIEVRNQYLDKIDEILLVKMVSWLLFDCFGSCSTVLAPV